MKRLWNNFPSQSIKELPIIIYCRNLGKMPKHGVSKQRGRFFLICPEQPPNCFWPPQKNCFYVERATSPENGTLS